MAKTQKYEELADKILNLVGGKENITYFTHCVTRLRFNLKDQSAADIKKIEEIPGVVGSQWQNGQLQIIIGQSVGDAYKLICKKGNSNEEDAVDENLDKDMPKKKFSFGMILDAISGSIVPIIPAMIGCGMIKVLLLLLQSFNWIDTAGGTYAVLSMVGDACFYFLPILVGRSAAKKFGANESLGMIMGAMLIYPTFVSGVAGGTSYSFLGIPVYSATYTSTVFPVILCCAVMAPIQRFFGKISPDAIRSVTEPLLTLLVMTPIAFCVLAPAGAFLGTYFSQAIIWLYNTTGFLGVAVLCAVFPFVVMIGMHTAFTPYLVQMMSSVGYEPIIVTANVISNINQGVACAVVALKTKNKNLKSTGTACAVTAIVGGVTEPAMYGITLRYKKAMYGAMIGNFAGAVFAGLMHVYCYAFPGSGGLFCIPAYIGSTGSNLLYLIIAWVIGAAVTFAATMILYKDEAEPETMKADA